MDRLRFVIVGNPENRRVQMFLQALASMQLTTALKLESRVLSYEDLLLGKLQLADFLTPKSVLRIESPGENDLVGRLLIARGAEASVGASCEWIDAVGAMRLAMDHGRIRFPKQLYLGFCDLMREIACSVADCEEVSTVNEACDIATMFDKAACRNRLIENGVPVPESLATPQSFEQLAQAMRESGMRRVFVKLASGSSASGVVALQIGKHRLSATTSVELVRIGSEIKLYNSLRMRTYHDVKEIEAIIDWLCRESVVVERWLPKATCNGMAFDLRVVVFPQGAQHVVVRQSRGPITNLHLGNSRGDWQQVRKLIGDGLQMLEETCSKISMAFPNSNCIAADVLVSPNFRGHSILELNAFGDLLPGILHNGHSTYQAVIANSIILATN